MPKSPGASAPDLAAAPRGSSLGQSLLELNERVEGCRAIADALHKASQTAWICDLEEVDTRVAGVALILMRLLEDASARLADLVEYPNVTDEEDDHAAR